MESVPVETLSETGDCQTNPELSDKQKKRSGKKKRKSRKPEDELKNNDSHISSQIGNADEAFSSQEKNEGEKEKSTIEDQVQLSENLLSSLPAESCQQDSFSCAEPVATLHHTDAVTCEDSLSDANRKGSSRKKSKRREKKKTEDASCDEKMLDDAEKITNEDQVHPPNNPLSNGIIQEGSHEHTQDSCEKPGAAQLCTDSNLSTCEDSQPDATNMISSPKKKRKKKRGRNALKESGVDTNSTNAEVAVKYSTITEAEVSRSMSIEENSIASVLINSCPKSKVDTGEQLEGNDVKINETVSQTESPKAKKRKKKKTKTMDVCDPLGNTLPTCSKSGPVECVENNDGNKETVGTTEVKEDVLEVKYDSISEAEGSISMTKEEKSVASVVISSCPKSKDDTVEQQECADVKCNETVAQTQNPKAKRRKKRKTETLEDCDPLGNTLSTSTKSGPVECVENNDGHGGRELICYSASQRENSVTGEESGFLNLGKTKEKETDKNTEVKEDVLGAGVCDVSSKKRKRKKKKTSSADIEVCEPSGSVDCLLDHSNEKVMQNCDENAGKEFGGEDKTSKIEKSATREKSKVQKSGKHKEMTKDENIESNQDALGAEDVSDVGRKRQKRKMKTKTNCESVATMDSESVQCLLHQSSREGVKNCDGNADGEIASKDLASNIEDSASKGESVQGVKNTKKKKKDKKGKVDQDALGAEGVSKVEVTTKKSKKKKNSLDHKTDDMEEDNQKENENKGEVDQNSLGAGVSKVEVKTKESKKKKNSLDHKTDDMEEKDDVSLPSKDAEPEFDREKLETSLSSSVLIQNNVAQGVASSETGDVPRCSCAGQRTRKLLVFDLNGILADIVQGFTGPFVPDGKVSYRSVFRRPFVSSFLDFCFERFHVAIWSSRRVGLDYMVSIVMKNYSRNLLFCFDQNKCTTTKFKTQEKNDKPLFLKDLRTVWDQFGTCTSCGKRKYDETNTLLVDDSPDKALCNPPHTGIFPSPYQYTDRQDSALGPEGELRKYLERLADAENVQKFVAENPFGQTAITEIHESWEFYSKVVEAHK
ncbi:HAD-like superfamily [Arabidopsis thaliana x Arabidopsis arenosa]|uniref:HAD-like superfamily n=1 Tax=Arabidopsis thaliana x Arabidopsis arenosa TaxID=1240361 RepID=A0A8T1Y431_9BRAS|nr:HAD-like superfamily [Arabidopsis thaliana x Arabidopsis arenosa]